MSPSFGQSPRAARPSVVLAVLLVISLVCVTLYAREGEDGAIHAVQHAASGLFAPAKSLSGSVSAAEQAIVTGIEDVRADANTLSELREQNQQLRATIAQLEEFRQEAERLEGLLAVRTMYQAQGVPARVLGRSTDSWNRVVTIDAGSADGVRAGLPVMGPSGLVGQVVSTTDGSSDVRLLSDAQSGVAVIIQSSREEGIVHGSIEGLLYLDDVPDDVEVQSGDVLITSGLGGGYYRGIVVGTVLKVEGEAGATTRKIIVEPNEQADPLEDVYVVTSMVTSIDLPSKSEEEAASTEDAESSESTDSDGYYDTEEEEY